MLPPRRGTEEATMVKLWETSPSVLDPGLESFLSSLSVDAGILREDLQGSIAHASMLGERGILPKATAAELVAELRRMESEAVAGRLEIDPSAEDVHSFVEATLTARLGEAGKSLHAGRSRNDQVALDLRLRLRRYSAELRLAILDALDAFLGLAKEHLDTVMPGYTHLQRAQPVSFAHHLLAWAAALERDLGRLEDADRRADECPLGSCALAGTGLPIDRELSAESLGFSRPSRNTMDAVADRDAATEFASACALIAMHLSRFGEELCLWASAEYGFISLAPTVSTGSSVMPQKRNPDPAELIRGKAGRSYGALLNLLVLQKGLPLAYDRDLQEDKAAVFDAAETAIASVRALATLVKGIEVQSDRMRAAAEEGCLWAADAAEFLVLRGVPFRTAYAAGRRLVEAWRSAASGGGWGRVPAVSGLIARPGPAGLEALHPAWKGVLPVEIAPYLSLEACLGRRDLPGGPAPQRCAREIERLLTLVAEKRGKLPGTP